MKWARVEPNRRSVGRFRGAEPRSICTSIGYVVNLVLYPRPRSLMANSIQSQYSDLSRWHDFFTVLPMLQSRMAVDHLELAKAIPDAQRMSPP